LAGPIAPTLPEPSRSKRGGGVRHRAESGQYHRRGEARGAQSHRGNGDECVTLRSDADTVRGNLIGTDQSGTADLGNSDRGFRLGATVSNDVVKDNVVALKNDNGVEVNLFVGERILNNSIFSNSGLGIDLFGGGREQGPKDLDTGPTTRTSPL